MPNKAVSPLPLLRKHSPLGMLTSVHPRADWSKFGTVMKLTVLLQLEAFTCVGFQLELVLSRNSENFVLVFFICISNLTWQVMFQTVCEWLF